ncbi:hypothetical protein LOK49_LG10G02508 [Camellia lanceoleosa]|uniref:Uncharacterized protein n=1 Tax=Camellia lanceoleosa TaxID=1840588 RepID=A0ACC0GEI5_9ERIC|nr:hypothetical protein LOK49_LG10G02508 [Camellia lanceoleosa]
MAMKNCNNWLLQNIALFPLILYFYAQDGVFRC